MLRRSQLSVIPLTTRQDQCESQRQVWPVSPEALAIEGCLGLGDLKLGQMRGSGGIKPDMPCRPKEEQKSRR
jgi:hypothetical protein